jgi:tetratricopeptide (TPR) repeat protein
MSGRGAGHGSGHGRVRGGLLMSGRAAVTTKVGRAVVVLLAAPLFAALLAAPILAAPQGGDLGQENRAFIEKHFRAAKGFEASQELAKAAAEYELILEKYPTALPRVYQNLGLVQYQQRKYEEAIAAFEKGLEFDPEMPGSHLFLGISYLNIESPEKALPHLESAHRSQATTESATALGHGYMVFQRHDQAIRSFKEALSLSGADQPSVRYLIANSYLKLAERIVNEQTEKYPKSKDTHLAAAKLFESQKGYQIAAIKYLEAAELDPANASIFFPLARMLAVLGLDVPSRLALERYWALMPNVPRTPIDKQMLPKEQVAEIGTKVDFEGILRSLPEVARDKLPPLPMLTRDMSDRLEEQLRADKTGKWKAAVTHLSGGRFPEGLQALRDAESEGAPTDARWVRDYLEASTHVWLDDYRKAGEVLERPTIAAQPVQAVRTLRAEVFRQLSIEHFTELVREHPDSCRAHLVKAQNLAAQEKAEAEGEFRAAIDGCPSETQIRVDLADYYLWNSRYEEARQECLQELEINPYSSAAKKRLGRIHVQLREADKALPYLLEVAAGDAGDPDVRTDLGRAYELLQKWDEALSQYQAALRIDPTLNRVHYVLARIYRQLGKKELAQEEFRLFKASEEADRQRRVEQIQRLRQREVGDGSSR